jgi:hypothetical protein
MYLFRKGSYRCNRYIWCTWVDQKVCRLIHTDRQPMALCECFLLWLIAGNVTTHCANWLRSVNRELHNMCFCHPLFSHVCDVSMDLKMESEQTSNSASNSANQVRRLLTCYDMRMVMTPCVVRHVSSGMSSSREAEHHSKTMRGQGDLPPAPPLKMWKQFGGLCMRIVG